MARLSKSRRSPAQSTDQAPVTAQPSNTAPAPAAPKENRSMNRSKTFRETPVNNIVAASVEVVSLTTAEPVTVIGKDGVAESYQRYYAKDEADKLIDVRDAIKANRSLRLYFNRKRYQFVLSNGVVMHRVAKWDANGTHIVEISEKEVGTYSIDALPEGPAFQKKRFDAFGVHTSYENVPSTVFTDDQGTKWASPNWAGQLVMTVTVPNPDDDSQTIQAALRLPIYACAIHRVKADYLAVCEAVARRTEGHRDGFKPTMNTHEGLLLSPAALYTEVEKSKFFIKKA